MKEKIKENLLSLLITKDTNVRRGISNLIAVIASIEIPRNEWPTII